MIPPEFTSKKEAVNYAFNVIQNALTTADYCFYRMKIALKKYHVKRTDTRLEIIIEVCEDEIKK